MKRAFAGLLFLAGVGYAARTAADKPVGLIVTAGQARLLRSGTMLEINLRKGDLVFAGDRISADAGESVLWYCPATQAIHLVAGAVVRIEDRRVAELRGRDLPAEPLPFCPVPDITRADLERPAFLAREVSRARFSGGDVQRDLVGIPAATREAMELELRRIEGASVSDPALLLAGRAAVLSRYGAHLSAAELFQSLAAAWDTTDWPRQLVHEQHDLASRGEATPSAIGGTGQTYALLIGISDYPLLRPEQRLQFADRDAELLNDLLRSPRGGTVPPENIRMLRNKDATAAAIRTNIADFLRARASRNDTVVLLISAHGVSSPDGAFIVAYDTDPDNLPDTGINMLEIQELLEGGLEHVGHVLIFVDVCHAGLIGNIQTKNFSRVLQILGQFKGEETLGLLATAPEEKSVESERFGGGHGAFSYFLTQALNGSADEDGDSRVSVSELQAYVFNMVRQSTKNRQNPRQIGDMPNDRILIPDVSRAGIEIAGWQSLNTLAVAKPKGIAVSDSSVADAFADDLDVQPFEQAIRSGTLLPPGNDNALDLLARLRTLLAGNPLRLLTLENQLRIALQDRGQEVLLRYLRGEEVPQVRQDFEYGAQWFEAALALDPEALAWQSRAWFCRARALLFERRFAEASELLERAVRIEPEGPYLYNAFGLLFLQLGEFQRAAAAFQDAVRLAPYWSYPRHNLALTLAQTGEYDRAMAVYRDAQRIAPQAWFIAYNAGLLEQRVKELGQAERLFRKSAELAPARPEPETALGYLAALRGRTAEAERFYRTALQKQPDFLPAMHDLALLLSESRRTDEAILTWKSILQREPAFTASRMALAASYERSGLAAEALAEYREAVRMDPQLTGAELAAARLLLLLHKNDDAERIIRKLVGAQPLNAGAWELLGDLLTDTQKMPEAAQAYERARPISGGEQRRQIERKLKQLRKSRA